MSKRRSGLVGLDALPVFDALMDADEEAIVAEGMAEIECRDRLIEEELKAVPWREIAMMTTSGEWIKVPVLMIRNKECDRHYSLLCHRLAKLCGTPFAGVVTTDRETMSLRSSGFDTVPIAKAYGGGGHTKASGFPLSDRHRQELIDGDRLTPTQTN